MAKGPRIGILGGTFDPIHNVHIDIARAALHFADLDKVLFMVSARPPHKRGEYVATADERLAMVEAALANEPNMEASRLELDREGPSYTVDTLRVLHEQYPGAKLFLIVGLDSLADLPAWKDAEGILAQAHVLAVPRPGDIDVPPAMQDRYTMLPFPAIDESSTEVRDLLAKGEDPEGRVPAAAAELIRQRKIYHGDPSDSART